MTRALILGATGDTPPSEVKILDEWTPGLAEAARELIAGGAKSAEIVGFVLDDGKEISAYVIPLGEFREMVVTSPDVDSATWMLRQVENTLPDGQLRVIAALKSGCTSARLMVNPVRIQAGFMSKGGQA